MSNSISKDSTITNKAFAEELTPDNAACILIDHQTGLLQFLPSIEPTVLKNNILGLTKPRRLSICR